MNLPNIPREVAATPYGRPCQRLGQMNKGAFMKDRLASSSARPRRSFVTKRSALATALSLGALLATATPSFAGTTSHLKEANGSAYCTLLVAYDKKQTAANKALETPGGAIAAEKAAYKSLTSIEGTVLNVAPSVLQSSFKTVFKELNVFYTDLSKVNFDYAKLTKAQIASFESISKTMAAASNKITAYDKKVCGVKS